MVKRSARYLSADQLHFNRVTLRKKGNPRKDPKAKRYLFGHFTKQGKHYNKYGRRGKR